MKIERLRKLKNARPFVPFRIHRSDGDPVEVRSGDTIGISPKENWVLVSLPNEGTVRIGASDVTNAEVIGFLAPEDSEFL